MKQEREHAADMLEAMGKKLSDIIDTFTKATPPNVSLQTKQKTLADMHNQLSALRMGAHALRYFTWYGGKENEIQEKGPAKEN